MPPDSSPSASEFDPYLEWLGIPPDEQPPHHYRLLGIELFEEDPDTIEGAARQRYAELRPQLQGPYGEYAQQLSQHLKVARLCLLNEARKIAYDAELSDELSLEPAVPDRGGFQIEQGSSAKSKRGKSGVVGLIIAILSPTVLLGVGWLVGTKLGLFNAPAPVAGRQPAVDVVPEEQPSGDAVKLPQTARTDETQSTIRPFDEQFPPEQPARQNLRADQRRSGFQAPAGVLVDTSDPEDPEDEMPAETPVATQPAASPSTIAASRKTDNESPSTSRPARPATTEVARADASAEPEVSDGKLNQALKKLQTEREVAQGRVFKTLKSKLSDASKSKDKKPLSTALRARLDQMLEQCDKQEFPEVRVTGTISYSGHDYAYIDGDFTWNTARERCETFGGHLVTLNNSSESDFVVQKFLAPNRKPAWLGGTDQAEEGQWKWVTGEPWRFQAFLNNDHGLAHALTWWRDIRFHDWIGDRRQALVCEWESTGGQDLIDLCANPEIIQAVWEAQFQQRLNLRNNRNKVFRAVNEAVTRLEKGGDSSSADLYEKFGFEKPPPQRTTYKKSEYFLFTQPKTWHEARIHCENLGGHLVVFDTPGEDVAVLNAFSRNGTAFWIGCTDEEAEGRWFWVTGAPCGFRMKKDNFAGDQHVGHLVLNNNKMEWVDGCGSLRDAYVCEWEVD